MKTRQKSKYGLIAVITRGMEAAVAKALVIIAVTLLLFTFAACDEDQLEPLTGTVTINITGNQVYVGDTVTATYSSGNGSGDATWQWLYDDKVISSANAKSDTYLITENDLIGGLNKTLKARVSFSENNGSIESTQNIIVRESNKPALTGTVTIDNTGPKVGETLTAVYSGGNGTGTAIWQWLVNDTPLSNTNKNTYVVADNDLNKTIKARVSYSSHRGNVTSAVTSAVVDKNKPALTGTVTINNTDPKVGDTLTAAYDGNGTGTPTWQWFVGIDLIEITSDSYTVISNDLGKTLTVRVSFSNQSGNVTSRATRAVEAKSSNEPTEPIATGNFTYELISSGTAYRVRQGTTTTGALTIPATHEGKPVTEIGGATDSPSNGAFSNTAITSVTIPSSITSIGSNAFYNCASLTSVTFSSTSAVTNIRAYAFSKCTSLTSITIPASVTTISDAVFAGSTSLKITVAAGNNNFSSDDTAGILYDKTKIELIAYPSANGSVTIPTSVSSIRGEAFRNCKGLTSINLSNVGFIGLWAFYWCDNITSVTIPASVKTISERAFFGCDKLTSVTFAGSITTFGNDAFPQGTTDGDILKTAYLAGGAGTYTRSSNKAIDWKKQ